MSESCDRALHNFLSEYIFDIERVKKLIVSEYIVYTEGEYKFIMRVCAESKVAKRSSRTRTAIHIPTDWIGECINRLMDA
jgi:hypothetical protein